MAEDKVTKLTKAAAGRPSVNRENRKVRLIFEAARRFFLERDYDTTSMDAIAHEAGVSKATLYAHFSGKEELLLALVRDEIRVVPSLWTAKPGPIDVERGLQGIARTFAEFIFMDHAMPTHRLIMTYGRRFPKVAEIFVSNGPVRHRNEIAGFLRAAVDQGLLAIPDIELAATQFLSLLIGDLPMRRELHQELPSRREYQAIAASAIWVFLSAYGSPGDRPRKAASRTAARSPSARPAAKAAKAQ